MLKRCPKEPDHLPRLVRPQDLAAQAVALAATLSLAVWQPLPVNAQTFPSSIIVSDVDLKAALKEFKSQDLVDVPPPPPQTGEIIAKKVAEKEDVVDPNKVKEEAKARREAMRKEAKEKTEERERAEAAAVAPVFKVASPDAPVIKAPDVPVFKAPDVPKTEAAPAPVFKVASPDAPVFKAPDVPVFKAPDVPVFKAPDVSKTAAAPAPVFKVASPDAPVDPNKVKEEAKARREAMRKEAKEKAEERERAEATAPAPVFKVASPDAPVIKAPDVPVFKVTSPSVPDMPDLTGNAQKTATEATKLAEEKSNAAKQAVSETAANAVKQADEAKRVAAETAAATTKRVDDTSASVKNSVQDTQSAIKETAADIRRKVVGTALERFQAAKEYETEANLKLLETSTKMIEAKESIDRAANDVARADKLLQGLLNDEKAALSSLKKISPAMAKVQSVTEAEQAFLTNAVEKRYAKAEELKGLEDTEPRNLADIYAEAASLEVKLRLLPNPERLGKFPEILQAAQDNLDTAKVQGVRDALSKASADQKSSLNSLTLAVTDGSAAVKGAIKGGIKPTPQALASVKSNIASAKLSSKAAADGYGATLKQSRELDQALRSGAEELKAVRLERWDVFAKEADLVKDTQATVKKLVSKDIKAEEKAIKSAAKKLTQARSTWDAAEKSLEEAIRAENKAQELYTEAVRLGKEEAAIFGKAL